MEFPISPYHWLGLLAHIPTKFIALAKPRMVLIEDVPPRTYGDNPMAPVYGKLEKDV
jgi:hypothetical protein